MFQSSSKYSFLLLTTLSPDEDELSFFCPPMDPREMFESVLRLKEPLDTVVTTERERERETDKNKKTCIKNKKSFKSKMRGREKTQMEFILVLQNAILSCIKSCPDSEGLTFNERLHGERKEVGRLDMK